MTGQVAVVERAHDELADARQHEHGLDDRAAPQQDADVDADHRDDGDQGVPKGVAHEDDAVVQALRPRRADVVLVEDLEHARAGEAREERRQVRAEREAREDEERHRLPDPSRDRLVAHDRQEVEPQREQDDEHQPQPEARQREAHQGEKASGVVDPRVPEGGGQEAGGHADGDGEHQGESHQGERRRHAPDELLGHAGLVVEGLAEVAARDLTEPFQVPHVERTVEAQLATELLDGLGRALAAHDHQRRVPRDDVDQRERRDAEGQQHRDERDQAPEDQPDQGMHG